MIRKATIADSDFIAKRLWAIRNHFKARQIATALSKFKSVELIDHEVQTNIDRWLLIESVETSRTGFFSLLTISDNRAFKRFGFPKRFIEIEYFDYLLKDEILLEHFHLLLAYLERENILLIVDASLRAAYWAAVKAGFCSLGESPTLVGTSAWLYFDRGQNQEVIRMKMRKSKIIL